jgi:hypothetical protein
MSVPHAIISCLKCGFESGTNRSWGIYIYRLPNSNEIPVPSTMGWCTRCKDFKPIETLTFIQEVQDNLRRQNEELERLKKNMRFLHRIFNSYKDKIVTIQERLAEMEQLLLLLDLRKTPPKCLVCGCTDISSIKLQSGEKAKIIGFVHPECGGYFTIKPSEYRLHYVFPKRFYNIDGNHIGTVEND